MARNVNVPNNITSSPPSGGTITHNGTPSTIPTIISPDGGNCLGETGATIPQLDLAGTSGARTNLASRRNHTVAPVSISATNLRPVARDFQPDMTPVASGPFRNSSVIGPLPPPNVWISSNNRPGIVGPHRDLNPILERLPFQLGMFTVDDGMFRAFHVVGLSHTSENLLHTVKNCYQDFPSLVNVDMHRLPVDGGFTVAFSDHRDTAEAYRLTCDTSLYYSYSFNCFVLSPKELAVHEGVDPNIVSNHAGEYILSVNNLRGSLDSFTHDEIVEVCQTLGDVKAIQSVEPSGRATEAYRVEWYDSRVNVIRLNGVQFKGYRLTITPHTPDVDHVAVRLYEMNRLNDRLNEQIFDQYNQRRRNPPIFSAPRTPVSPTSTVHNTVDIRKVAQGQDVRTTVMLRNIPNRVDQATLKRLLDETSYGKYDFMYLRIDFQNNCNVGYAFINFVDPVDIIDFYQARAGKKWNMFQSDKVGDVSYATIQGRDCLIAKFRNSSVMLEQPAFRPKLYYACNHPLAGTEEPFPKPDNHAKLKRSCDNAEHVGLYHPTTPFARIRSRRQVKSIAPPRNQPVGGVYTTPATNRRAIAYNRQFTKRAARHGVQGPATSSPSSQNIPSSSLFAPNEGQAFRDKQRRQASQYDRGTPGAEIELAAMHNRVVPVLPTGNMFNATPAYPQSYARPSYNAANDLNDFQRLNMN